MIQKLHGAINRLHFFLAPVSGMCVMQIWGRIHLVPSSTRFKRRLEHSSIPSQKVACNCTRLRNTAENYIISIVHKLKFLLSLQSNAQRWTEYRIDLMRLFSAPEIFISYAYGTKNRRQKKESIYGASFWSVCHWPHGLITMTHVLMMSHATNNTSYSYNRPTLMGCLCMVQNYKYAQAQ